MGDAELLEQAVAELVPRREGQVLRDPAAALVVAEDAADEAGAHAAELVVDVATHQDSAALVDDLEEHVADLVELLVLGVAAVDVDREQDAVAVDLVQVDDDLLVRARAVSGSVVSEETHAGQLGVAVEDQRLLQTRVDGAEGVRLTEVAVDLQGCRVEVGVAEHLGVPAEASRDAGELVELAHAEQVGLSGLVTEQVHVRYSLVVGFLPIELAAGLRQPTHHICLLTLCQLFFVRK